MVISLSFQSANPVLISLSNGLVIVLLLMPPLVGMLFLIRFVHLPPSLFWGVGGSVVKRLEFSPQTSEATGSNLGPGASCGKVGSYLPMPRGLQLHWFPPPVNYPSQYDPGC